MALSARQILDIAYAPLRGKKTGEKTLMLKILERCKYNNLLFLFDAGFYSFFLARTIINNGQDFIMKMTKSVKLKPIPGSQMADGSYLSEIHGKIEDPAGSENDRKKWLKVSIVVRVICFQIPGYRPVRLITSILDSDITAMAIIKHYHKRWDIEIAYDEIKTHQCATLKGQTPTILRSKRPDLVEQELYAVVIIYNLIRSVIHESASNEGQDPLFISFLDTMQLIIDSAPIISSSLLSEQKHAVLYLYQLIANSQIDRPRRPRCNPRVVKVKMSNFKRKRDKDKSIYRNFEKELKIIYLETA